MIHTAKQGTNHIAVGAARSEDVLGLANISTALC